MRVVATVSDRNFDGYKYYLKTSAALNRLEMVVLLCGSTGYTDHRVKDIALKEYLDELNNDEIILFTDGYDAVFLAEEKEIQHKYHQIGKPLLFSAESNCWPDPGLSNRYGSGGETPYKYLNSGGFVGKVGLIKELLSEELPRGKDAYPRSNQYTWALRYLENTQRIGLDTDCHIFSTMSSALDNELINGETNPEYYSWVKHNWFRENFSIRAGRLYNRICKTWPCHVHFNGPSKILMDAEIMDMICAKIPCYESVVYRPFAGRYPALS